MSKTRDSGSTKSKKSPYWTWVDNHGGIQTFAGDPDQASDEMLAERMDHIWPAHDPIRVAEKNRMRAKMWAAVECLPRRQREAILLTVKEELTQAEAAKRMGCDQCSVSRHVQAGTKNIKKVLAGHCIKPRKQGSIVGTLTTLKTQRSTGLI